MLIVKINGTDYRIKTGWDDLTLKDCTKLSEVINKAPERMQEYWEAIKAGEDFEPTEQETIKDFPMFYGKVMGCLSTIPANILKQVFWHERTAYYKQILEPLVFGVKYMPVDFEPKGIKSFKWNKEELHLPSSEVILGIERPMADAQAVEFTESADLMLAASNMQNNLAYAANVVSILCRPKGEAYNERKSLKRAEGMDKLPMNIVWEVFFSLIKHAHLSEIITQTFTQVQQEQQKQAEAVH